MRTICLCLHFSDEHDERGICQVRENGELCGCSCVYNFEMTVEQLLAWYKGKWDVHGDNDRI